MNNQEWLAKAIAKIAELEGSKTFEVKDLFREVDWNTLSKGDRIGFGRFFANEVREKRIKSVVALERGKDNHSRYQKV